MGPKDQLANSFTGKSPHYENNLGLDPAIELYELENKYDV